MTEALPNGSYESRSEYHYFDKEERAQDIATALETFESVMSGTPSSEDGSYDSVVDADGCYRKRTFSYTQGGTDTIDEQLYMVETNVILAHSQKRVGIVREAYDVRVERRIKIAKRHVLDASDEIGLVTERYVTDDPLIEQYSLDVRPGGSVDAWAESSDIIHNGGYDTREMTKYDFHNLQKCFAEVQSLEDIRQRERDTIRMLTN